MWRATVGSVLLLLAAVTTACAGEDGGTADAGLSSQPDTNDGTTADDGTADAGAGDGRATEDADGAAEGGSVAGDGVDAGGPLPTDPEFVRVAGEAVAELANEKAETACSRFPAASAEALATGDDPLALQAATTGLSVTCDYTRPDPAQPSLLEVVFGWAYAPDRTPAEQWDLDREWLGPNATAEPVDGYGDGAFLADTQGPMVYVAVPYGRGVVVASAADRDTALRLLDALVAEAL